MSTDFTWERKGNNIIIQYKRLRSWRRNEPIRSQWMAQEGKPYSEIVQYYYQGVEIANADPFITTITAKK